VGLASVKVCFSGRVVFPKVESRFVEVLLGPQCILGSPKVRVRTECVFLAARCSPKWILVAFCWSSFGRAGIFLLKVGSYFLEVLELRNSRSGIKI
jgi:hypothetical protein